MSVRRDHPVESLVCRAQQGDRRATDRIVRRYTGFCYVTADEFYLRTGDRDDLRQEALLGLLKAIRDYQPDRGSSFISFVRLCVRRQLITVLKRERASKHAVLTRSVREAVDEHGDLFPIVDFLPAVASTEAQADARELLASVISGLPSLSTLEARAIVGVAVGVSYEELGGFKQTDNAVQRARLKLRAAA